MRTFLDIIADAGGPTALAKAIGEDPNTVHAWKRGKSIPATRWKAVSTAGIATLEELADAADARRTAGTCGLPEPANDTPPQEAAA